LTIYSNNEIIKNKLNNHNGSLDTHGIRCKL
jgi:hypothetical protein